MLAPNPEFPARPAKLLVTARQGAKLLEISERKLWTLSNRGDIPRIKIDRLVRYAIEDLQDYIDRQRAASR